MIMEFIQGLLLVRGVIALVLGICRFLRDVWDEIHRPTGLHGVRVFGLWTWGFFFPMILLACMFGAVIAVLTGSIVATLGAFVFLALPCLALWLMPFMGPVLLRRTNGLLGRSR